jgi:outer membrane receptor for ferrienterochelin and colicin
MKIAPLLLVVSLTAAAPLPAQTTGATLQGTIADEQGAVLPGAAITITNTETGRVRELTTDEKGWFRAPALTPGRYELRAALSGFATQVRSGLTLTVAQEATLNVTLKVASVAESVIVTAESPIVETTKSSLGTTVTHAQLDNLPIAARDFTQLANLTAGVTGVGGGGVNAGGQLSRSDTWLIDGVRNDETAVSGARGGFSLEAVREYIVMPSQFTAEYGNASGAVVSVVTRSGTNIVQGRGFLLARSDAMDAQDPFSKAQGSGKAPFSQQRYGGFLGGPITKDRLHYFGSWEALRQRQTSVITSPLVPVSEREWPLNTDGNQVFAKVTRQLRQNHTVDVKYRLDNRNATGVGIGGLNVHETGRDTVNRSQDYSLQETGVLSNRALNELRIQYSPFLRWSYTDNYSPSDAPQISRPSGTFGKISNQPQGDHEDYVQFSDNFSYTLASHNLKVGGGYMYGRDYAYFLGNKDGTFTFTTDKPFDPNDLSTYPTQYTRNVGDPITVGDDHIFTAFAQDSWRVRGNVTLNLGVRYDTETAWGAAPKVNVPDPRLNFSPRLGFAWDPKGDGRTAVRGGYGRYYDQIFLNVTENITLATQSVGVTIINPGYPDPYSRGTVAPPSKPSTIVASPAIKTPHTDTFSLGVKREVMKGMALSVDVVDTRGHDLYNSPDINYPDAITRIRPNPNFLRITQYETSGHSWYDAMLVSLERRRASGPSFGVSYTLSRAIRDVEDFNFVAQDQNNRAAEKAPSNNDRRHQFVANATWSLPAGFQIAGLLQARSGLAYNITTGADNNADTVTNDRPDLVVVGGSYRDAKTFSGAFTGRVGNLGRNAGRGPNWVQLDTRLSKSVRLATKRIEAFVEAFNLLNRTNFGLPVGNIRSSLFGQSTGLAASTNPRQVELGFRFDF